MGIRNPARQWHHYRMSPGEFRALGFLVDSRPKKAQNIS